MIMIMDDTIVAPSTAPGRSGIGIIRVSGKQSKYVAKKILGTLPKPRYAHYSLFSDFSGNIIDEGIALWFPAPNSFTGEDLLELQGHGNPVILDLLINTILSIKDVRIARPGEFSERAFTNGKIDLVQAESIIKLIHAQNETSVKSALQSLQGLFSKNINNLIKKIIHIRVIIESVLNFPEEDIETNFENINKKIQGIISSLQNIYKVANTSKIMAQGTKVVIVGASNAGKSSIFNALILDDFAIVTDIQGTTRDVLHDFINIKGVSFQITDTAGLRSTDDVIEKIGINKTLHQIQISDHILLVIDNTLPYKKKIRSIIKYINLFPKNIKLTVLLNKTDLYDKIDDITGSVKDANVIAVSAKSYDGIDDLKQHLYTSMMISVDYHSETMFLARKRHLNILNKATVLINKINDNWKIFKNIEFLSEDFKNMQNLLNEITGCVTSQDILNSIFSQFCIGK